MGDPAALQNLVASTAVSARPDPFALRPQERVFDMAQLAERLNQEGGPQQLLYEAPIKLDETTEPDEPQPYRRLSGVIVGDSVLGILLTPSLSDEGQILRPGQTVPGTDFVVASIDDEKMVLRREGNVRPKQVIVRLEKSPQGPSGFASGAGGAGGPGRPGGGPPPGVPGATGAGGNAGQAD
jgi:hypothetical protein